MAAIRSLCPLPDTTHEVRCVAKSLGGNGNILMLGDSMTESAVKSAALDEYRIIHFATHGLLAEEAFQLGKVNEPALVFTPPAAPTEQDDGLLTASEIAGLRLDADWVILSACNTAAGGSGEASGATALSGLAQAFFYAGARTLLVSHWPVNSNAATLITSRTFSQINRNPAIARAEAFRRAMMSLITDQKATWHANPAVWAPFVSVGENGSLH